MRCDPRVGHVRNKFEAGYFGQPYEGDCGAGIHRPIALVNRARVWRRTQRLRDCCVHQAVPLARALLSGAARTIVTVSTATALAQ